MQTSENIAELATALAKARKAFKPIKRDKTVKVQTRTGGSYTFAYAPIENIIEAITDALADNGLTILQGAKDGVVETRLIHSSGQWVCSETPLLIKHEYDKDGNDLGYGAQAWGSGCTYASRYGIKTLLALPTDEDDDGNAAEGNSVQTQARKISPMPEPEPLTAKENELVTSLLNSFMDTLNADMEDNAKADAFAKIREEAAEAGQHIQLALWARVDKPTQKVIRKYLDLANSRRRAA